MSDLFDLKGNVAIVTGCSTGLGVQMARALARQGCNIVAVARRQNLIEEVAADLAKEYGVETLAVRCDITDTEMVENAVKTVMDRFGRIDILINNAGTGAVAPAEDITDDQFMNELNIDLFGTFKMARGVVNLTRALAAEWGKYGISVNAICPGYFYSPLTRETLDSEFFQANAKTMIPMERYGDEGELDTAAIFLASPATTYVTGVMLPVDGGYTSM